MLLFCDPQKILLIHKAKGEKLVLETPTQKNPNESFDSYEPW